jgi:hypothetical protein
MEDFYNKLLPHDDTWCSWMGFFNPYTDPFKKAFTKKLPMFDKRAFHLYPKYNFVYDKLWVAISQDLSCGKPENISETSNIKYPIFIKPRWGHKSASSKNCFKITSYTHLQKYSHLEEMMWSEYIEGTENMTDYILLNGNIIHKITYLYSEEQNGYTECYKFISPNNEPPKHITEWVKHYMVGYSGVVNIQYRGDSIIEAGLRLARGGAYIQSTDNNDLVDMINTLYENNTYVYRSRESLNFEPFYSFKCFTRIPIVYIYPQYIIDLIMSLFRTKPFYEYYFEPNGNDGSVFFQFLHTNKNIGQTCVTLFTYFFIFAQLFFIVVGILIFYLFVTNKFTKSTWKMLLIILILYLTQYLNPISVHFNLHKAKRQQSYF